MKPSESSIFRLQNLKRTALVPCLALALGWPATGAAQPPLELEVTKVWDGHIGRVGDPALNGKKIKVDNPSPTSVGVGGLTFDVMSQSTFDQLREARIELISDANGDRISVLDQGTLLSDGLASGCSLPPAAVDESKWGGPDIIEFGNTRLMVSSYGNADILKGKIAVSWQNGGSSWNFLHTGSGTPFLFYPLCNQNVNDPSRFGDTECDQVGVSGTAALEVGSYLYVYFDIQRPNTPNHGIFLMRVPQTNSAPYVALSTGSAQLWNAKQKKWINLHFHHNFGYYFDICGSHFMNKAIVSGNPGKLGDVTVAADGSLIMTYDKWTDLNDRTAGEIVYRRSFDPTFADASEQTLDTQVLDTYFGNQLDRHRTNPSLHYVGMGDIEYLLFFTEHPLSSPAFDDHAVRVATVRKKGALNCPSPVSISDDFDNTSAGPLAGRSTQSGGKTWTANSNAVLRQVVGSTSGYVTGLTGSNMVGTFPYGGGCRPVVLEASIRPGTTGYTAVGFVDQATGGFFAAGELWVQIEPDGEYRLCANGTSNCPQGTTSITNFLGSDRLNEVKLRFDPSSNTVDLWINGVLEVANRSIPGNYVPQLLHAGLYGLSVTEYQSRVGYLSLTEE